MDPTSASAAASGRAEPYSGGHAIHTNDPEPSSQEPLHADPAKGTRSPSVVPGARLYERFVSPGTDPLWIRITFFSLLIVAGTCYAYDCYLSGSICPHRTQLQKKRERVPRIVRMQQVADAMEARKEKANAIARARVALIEDVASWDGGATGASTSTDAKEGNAAAERLEPKKEK
ncbi:unnamed protein product [Amoebophrya sp. A25]|nr:unnamed protein product [Amoebophrya sp. A25]|eukprot:GSA25T00017871001.1